MNNVSTDLSILTTIPEKTLDKLGEKILYVLCQSVQENVSDDKEISEFNFFNLFTLYIKHDASNEIKYRVVPSKEFEKAIEDTVNNKLNLLEDVVNDTLVKKFMNIHKEIC